MAKLRCNKFHLISNLSYEFYSIFKEGVDVHVMKTPCFLILLDCKPDITNFSLQDKTSPKITGKAGTLKRKLSFAYFKLSTTQL